MSGSSLLFPSMSTERDASVSPLAASSISVASPAKGYTSKVHSAWRPSTKLLLFFSFRLLLRVLRLSFSEPADGGSLLVLAVADDGDRKVSSKEFLGLIFSSDSVVIGGGGDRAGSTEELSSSIRLIFNSRFVVVSKCCLISCF